MEGVVGEDYSNIYIAALIYCFVFFGGLDCVGHSFTDVPHFVFLRDVWIRTHRATVASRRVTNLDTHLSSAEFSCQKKFSRSCMVFFAFYDISGIYRSDVNYVMNEPSCFPKLVL